MNRVLYALLVVCLLVACHEVSQTKEYRLEDTRLKLYLDSLTYERIQSSANQEDKRLLLYVDYSVPSNQERAWLLEIDSIQRDSLGAYRAPILESSHVTHGEGLVSNQSQVVFSNEPGSRCSSKGLFRFVEYYVTGTGGDPAYRLDGLDESNSNMRSRGVVFHPRIEVDAYVSGRKSIQLPFGRQHLMPFGRISYGCVVTTHRFFETVKAYREQGYTIYGYVR